MIRKTHVVKSVMCCIGSLKLHSLCELKLSTQGAPWKVKLNRNISAQSSIADSEIKKTNVASKKLKESFVVPQLTKKRMNAITSIAGITMGASHVSWIKFAIPSLDVLDWNARMLPPDFITCRDETKIMKLAYEMKYALPCSDLYVMETFSMTGRHLYFKINHLHLSSMLAVVLNGFIEDIDLKGKVVFQRMHVLNHLFDLVVGSERVSTRFLFENMLTNYLKLNNGEPVRINKKDIFSLVKMPPKLLGLYNESPDVKKEDLSLAFLFALSFIDINVFENKESVLKIQNAKESRLNVSLR